MLLSNFIFAVTVVLETVNTVFNNSGEGSEVINLAEFLNAKKNDSITFFFFDIKLLKRNGHYVQTLLIRAFTNTTLVESIPEKSIKVKNIWTL
jgi:hypothetical protein